MINLSLGGVRDPLNPERDTFSPLEAAAVEYAAPAACVVVAAVGNADQAPSRPWPFASYPAALPHVIGVSALARDGSVPDFSDRDRIFNDIAAPGQEIVSTYPRALSKARLHEPAGTPTAAPRTTAAPRGRPSPRRRCRVPRRCSCRVQSRADRRTRCRRS